MNHKKTLTKTWVVVILALFSCFLWGSAFPSIKLGYEIFQIPGNDPFGQIFFAGIRFTLAGIMVLVVAKILKYPLKLNFTSFKKVGALGLLQTTTQYIFFYIGLSNTTGSNGSILSSLSGFFVVLFAGFFFKSDRFTWKKALGVLIGFAGIVFLNLRGLDGFSMNFLGDGFIVISSLAGAFATIYTKKIAKNLSAFSISGYQLLIGGIVLGLVGFIGGGGIHLTFTFGGIALLIYMAFISAAAFSIWTVLLKYNGVAEISIFKSTIPVFGVLLSSLLLGEAIYPGVIIALISVIIGIVLINWKGKRDNEQT